MKKINAHWIPWPNFIFRGFAGMRLTTLFVLLFSIQTLSLVSAQQKVVTIKMQAATVKELLQEIEKQTDYNFIYESDKVDLTKKIDIDIANKPVEDALTEVLTQMGLSYSLNNNLIVIKVKENTPAAQKRVVSGKVVDAFGLEIPGVTVYVKGTSNATITDLDGAYNLSNVSNADTLVITFIGMVPEEFVVGEKSEFNATLYDNIVGLDEVVVVGYGSLSRKEVSSAITSIKGDALLTVGGNGPMMALQGKVAGLTIVNTATGDPNSGASIQLRGASSRNAGLAPLYVVDGVAGGSIDNLNQNDIASIDVLKGGAASAIYGTRGSNGVIVITTKKGSEEAQVTYSNYFSVDVPQKLVSNLTADEFIANNRGDNHGAKTDWLKEITRDYAFCQRHYLSVSGGNAKTTYYASGDYRKAEGIDTRSDRKEYGARLNVSHTPESNLFTASFNVAPRYISLNKADYGAFTQALTLNPTQPVMDPADPSNYYNATDGTTAAYNPVEVLNTFEDGEDIKLLDWSGVFKLNILENLNTQISVSESNTNNFSHYFQPSTYTRALPGINSNLDMAEATRNYKVYDTKNLEWIGNYIFDIKNHSFKLLGGYSYSYFNNQGIGASNKDFPSDFYKYNNLNLGRYNDDEKADGTSSFQDDSKLIAFFGRLNYNFDSELFLTASLRHEGSSKFGQSHRWGNFPAISAAWDMSQRSFVNQMSWVDNLKIRVDYGVTGNQDFASYKSLDLYKGYGFAPYNGIYYQVFGPNNNANYNLHWEQAINYNAGLDFTLLKGRISGSINYYYRINEELLGNFNSPNPPNIFDNTYANVGTMKNSGIEMQLSATIVDKSNFKYDISFAGATLQNEFVSFSDDNIAASDFVDMVGMPAPGTPGTIQRLEEGKRIGSFYMYKSAGVDANGALLVYDKNGNVIAGNLATLDDKQYVGNGLPEFTASLGNAFKYKNWDALVNFRGVFGYDIFNTTAFYIGTPSTARGTNTLATIYDGGKYSKLTNSRTLATASDYFLEDGTFVKLDNVTLGYTYTSKIKQFKSIRLYVTGRNLYTFTKYTGGDPESVSVNGLTPGVNNSLSYYPSTLQVLGGVQVSF